MHGNVFVHKMCTGTCILQQACPDPYACSLVPYCVPIYCPVPCYVIAICHTVLVSSDVLTRYHVECCAMCFSWPLLLFICFCFFHFGVLCSAFACSEVSLGLWDSLWLPQTPPPMLCAVVLFFNPAQCCSSVLCSFSILCFVIALCFTVSYTVLCYCPLNYCFLWCALLCFAFSCSCSVLATTLTKFC